ncbi:MAG: isocitrate/isopropylmalate family dehydrogenase [Planctomycetota bacterium]
MSKLEIALAPGDGIGPEIMKACLRIFEAAGVQEHVAFVEVAAGEKVFAQGDSRGLDDNAFETIERTGLVYKGPMGTPVGGGGKSINVTLRKTFGAFANLRHFQSLPGVDTVFSRAGVPVDIYVVRENIEDTYGGIEYRMTDDVIECKRLITAPGCDQVSKFAFETAARLGIKNVQCGHKANIMKLTDGLFLSRFFEAAKNYPDIEAGDTIIDALCMNLVLKPQKYEMIVLPNLQGDIVSDLAAGLVGGLGFAPSANIGDKISIFEAVHGTAPDIAGKGIANPTSLLFSGLMMLRHIGLLKQAGIIENALLKTLEDGIRTGDFAGDKEPVGTQPFADAIIERLGQNPSEPKAVPDQDTPTFAPKPRPEVNLRMNAFEGLNEAVVGTDIFVDSQLQPTEIGRRLEAICDGTPFKLTMMSNRGTQVWPTGSVYTEIVDHVRCRFELRDPSLIGRIGQMATIHLLQRIAEKLTIIEWRPLKEYDGVAGFSKAQGQ